MIIKAIRIRELAHKDECRRLLLGDTATPCEVRSTKSAKRTCAEKEYNPKRQARRRGDSCYTPCELTKNFGRAMHSVLQNAKRSRSNLRSLAHK